MQHVLPTRGSPRPKNTAAPPPFLNAATMTPPLTSKNGAVFHQESRVPRVAPGTAPWWTSHSPTERTGHPPPVQAGTESPGGRGPPWATMDDWEEAKASNQATAMQLRECR